MKKLQHIKICGIPYEIEYVPTIDEEVEGIVQGKILYSQSKILVKDSLPKDLQNEVLLHEIVHGLLNHIGQSELCGNEEFVQSMANALYNSSFKLVEEIKS